MRREKAITLTSHIRRAQLMVRSVVPEMLARGCGG